MPSRSLPSNLLAGTALFLALGGTAFAAVQITGKDVRDASLTGADIRNASLTGTDVKDGSLSAADLAKGTLKTGPAGPQGPAGATGPQGPAGPQGPVGPSAVYAVTTTESGGTSSTVDGTLTVQQAIALPAGSTYSLTAKAQLSSTTPVTVTCGLRAALDNLDSDTATITIPAGPAGAGPVRGSAVAALQTVTGRDTTLRCSGPATTAGGAGTGLKIEDLSLQAVKVAGFVAGG
ncbi:MAG: pentapeptide repeat-containing protein [Patulibacter minatonensis]